MTDAPLQPEPALRMEVYPLAIDRQLVIDTLVDLGFARDTVMNAQRIEFTPVGITVEHTRRDLAPGAGIPYYVAEDGDEAMTASATVRVPYRRTPRATS